MGVASDYCGWRYSSAYRNGTWNPFNLFLKKFSPEEAATLTDEQLRTEPFFEVGGNSLGDGKSLDCLLENSMVEVNGTDKSLTPSEFVDQMVGDLDDFKDYDFENDMVKKHVKVRDWLLAIAFPATTLPMGANPLGVGLGDDGKPIFPDKNNIDMTATCMTDSLLWPRTEKFEGKDDVPSWFHSDYKDIPYQHTWKFYQKINLLMK